MLFGSTELAASIAGIPARHLSVAVVAVSSSAGEVLFSDTTLYFTELLPILQLDKRYQFPQ